MKSESGLLTSLWETKRNGSGGQAGADGYPALSLPSLKEGVSRCHVVEQPVTDCHEISISRRWRKGEHLQNPKAAKQKEVSGVRMGHKSWEQKAALMWAWAWEAAQPRAAHGACASSFEGHWQQEKERSIMV